MPVNPVTGTAQPYAPQPSRSNNEQKSRARVEADREPRHSDRKEETSYSYSDRHRADRSDGNRTRTSEARMKGTKVDTTG